MEKKSKISKAILLAPSALVFFILLTACGGSNPAASGSSPAVSEPAKTAPESPASTPQSTPEATAVATPEATAGAVNDAMFMQLGASDYGISVPRSIVIDEVKYDERVDDMVACYKIQETSLDFDVYQFNKKGYPDTISALADKELDEYNGSDRKDETINGIETASYRSVEKYEGKKCNVITYAFESGSDYVEIAFWLNGGKAEKQASEIINSLDKVETQSLALGSSACSITVPAGYRESAVTERGKSDDMIAFYYSDSTPLTFSVYQFDKEGYPDTLDDFVKEETGEYQGSYIRAETINGIEVRSYRSVETYEETEYDVVTYAFEDGSDYLEIAFWLDHHVARYQANAIIHSLEKQLQ